MKTSKLAVIGPVLLVALFAAGGVVGRALALPLPASLVGLGLVLLGLRVAVMAAATAEPAKPARPIAPEAGSPGPVLRAANG